MKLFLDTSSLVKLYHRETGTDQLELLFSAFQITTIFLSELSKIEFTSTIWKKVRTRSVTELEAQVTLELFESDLEKYTFVATDSIIIEQARLLMSTYGAQGLRTLDSIQLATALSLTHQASLFLTADNLLKSFLTAEGLTTEIPGP